MKMLYKQFLIFRFFPPFGHIVFLSTLLLNTVSLCSSIIRKAKFHVCSWS